MTLELDRGKERGTRRLIGPINRVGVSDDSAIMSVIISAGGRSSLQLAASS